jgi:hypothetical protein
MTNSEESSVVDESVIKVITAPKKAHIYGKLSGLLLVATEEEFQEYLSFDTTEREYNDEYERSAALKAVMTMAEKEGVDFEQFYLFGAFNTQTTGMNDVNMNDPVWLDDETIYLKLDINSPMGNVTNDMAYYGFLYLVGKSVTKLKINNTTIILAEGLPESNLTEEERALEMLLGGF